MSLIYIAGIMRTGTTLLQELLTLLPYSFIFHEPWWGIGKFYNSDTAIAELQKFGIFDKIDNPDHATVP
jgi:hypothetical protein